MKKLTTLFLLALLSLQVRAETIIFQNSSWNLSGTNAMTNSLKIWSVGEIIGGQGIQTGFPIFLNTTNGLYTNSFTAGNYALEVLYGAQFPYAQVLYFQSLDNTTSNVVNFTNRWLSGGNFFLTQPGPQGPVGPINTNGLTTNDIRHIYFSGPLVVTNSITTDGGQVSTDGSGNATVQQLIVGPTTLYNDGHINGGGWNIDELGNLNANSYAVGGNFTVDSSGHLTAASLSGPGSGLTSLNASSLSSGTVPAASITNSSFAATLAPTFSGANLTSLSGSSISSGTLADARLSTNVPLYNASGTFGGTQTLNNLTVNGTLTASGSGITGTISQSVISNSGAVTMVALNANQLQTNGGIVSLRSGVTLTNIAVVGYVTNVGLSNVFIMGSSTYPSNFYNDLNGTVSFTNGTTFMRGSGNTFTGLHIGDNILISNTTSQFEIVGITNGTDIVRVYPSVGATWLGSNITIYPNALYFRDINGSYYGGIGNDGSYTIQSGPGANSGKIVLASPNGFDSFIMTLIGGDTLGQGVGMGLNLNNQTTTPFKIYNNVQYDTLDVCPDPTYGGAVQVRALTNFQGSFIPVRVNLTMDSGKLITGGINSGFATYNTNQYPIAATGWTNTNSFNCTLYITGATAATFTLNDGTNNIFTDTGLTFTTSETVGMGPSYKLTVASGTITGVAVASH